MAIPATPPGPPVAGPGPRRTRALTQLDTEPGVRRVRRAGQLARVCHKARAADRQVMHVHIPTSAVFLHLTSADLQRVEWGRMRPPGGTQSTTTSRCRPTTAASSSRTTSRCCPRRAAARRPPRTTASPWTSPRGGLGGLRHPRRRRLRLRRPRECRRRRHGPPRPRLLYLRAGADRAERARGGRPALRQRRRRARRGGLPGPRREGRARWSGVGMPRQAEQHGLYSSATNDTTASGHGQRSRLLRGQQPGHSPAHLDVQPPFSRRNEPPTDAAAAGTTAVAASWSPDVQRGGWGRSRRLWLRSRLAGAPQQGRARGPPWPRHRRFRVGMSPPPTPPRQRRQLWRLLGVLTSSGVAETAPEGCGCAHGSLGRPSRAAHGGLPGPGTADFASE